MNIVLYSFYCINCHTQIIIIQYKNRYLLLQSWCHICHSSTLIVVMNFKLNSTLYMISSYAKLLSSSSWRLNSFIFRFTIRLIPQYYTVKAWHMNIISHLLNRRVSLIRKGFYNIYNPAWMYSGSEHTTSQSYNKQVYC